MTLGIASWRHVGRSSNAIGVPLVIVYTAIVPVLRQDKAHSAYFDTDTLANFKLRFRNFSFGWSVIPLWTRLLFLFDPNRARGSPASNSSASAFAPSESYRPLAFCRGFV